MPGVFDTAGPTIGEYATALRRRWLVVGLVTVLAVGIGAAPTLLEDPTYASEVMVRDSYTSEGVPEIDEVRDQDPEDGDGDGDGDGGDGDGEDPDGDGDQDGAPEVEYEAAERLRELGSDVTTVLTNRMRAAVVDRLGPDAPAFGGVSASVVGFSTVIRIDVTAGSPEAAAAAATAYAEEFVERRTAAVVEPFHDQVDELEARVAAAEEELSELEEQLTSAGLAQVERALLMSKRTEAIEEARDARRRADRLELAADLRESGIEVISDAGVNRDPVAPDRRRALGASLVIGLLLGVAAAVLLDRFRRRPARDESPGPAPGS